MRVIKPPRAYKNVSGINLIGQKTTFTTINIIVGTQNWYWYSNF